MASGTVEWFNDVGGYGFISPDDGGSRLYVRGLNVELAGGPTLRPGERVEFDRREGGMGPEAVAVVRPAPVSEASAPA